MKGLQLLRFALRNVASPSISKEDSINFHQDLTYESDQKEKEGPKATKKRKMTLYKSRLRRNLRLLGHLRKRICNLRRKKSK